MPKIVDPSADLRENHRLAWLALVYGSDRSHTGNLGYPDDVERRYEYDSLVQNSKRVQVGDLLLLTGKGGLLGLARIARIVPSLVSKPVTRCPTCRTTGYRRRKRMKPEFCCKRGHEFTTPVDDLLECVHYVGELEGFVPASRAVSLAELRYGRTDKATQVVIGPVDVELVREIILSRVPHARRLLDAAID